MSGATHELAIAKRMMYDDGSGVTAKRVSSREVLGSDARRARPTSLYNRHAKVDEEPSGHAQKRPRAKRDAVER